MAEPTAPLTTTTLTTTNNTDEAPLMTTPATPVTAAMQMAHLDVAQVHTTALDIYAPVYCKCNGSSTVACIIPAQDNT